MEEEITCKLCDKKFKESDELIICNGPCDNKVHPKCVGFNTTTLNFYKECDNLIYECDTCQKNPIRMMNRSVKKLLSFMCIFNERINRQEINSETIFKRLDGITESFLDLKVEIKSEIKKVTDSVTDNDDKMNKTITYAKAVKSIMVEPVVLVKPKKNQKCADTRDELNRKVLQNVDNVKGVNNIPKGGIEIKCNSNEDRSNIQKKAMEELGEEYNVIIPKLRHPKIKIVNMSEKLTSEEIINNIKSQNKAIEEAEMKVVSVYEMRNTESYGCRSRNKSI